MSSAKTQHYKDLVLSVDFLKNNILPVNNTSGQYTQKEKLHIRAFKFLAHAEFETYLENICQDVINATLNNTNPKSKQKVEATVVNFHSIATEKRHTNGITINSALKAYAQIIKKNHGIKEKNIFSMFMPIGINFEKIDSMLLLALDNFGEVRGKIAHNTFNHQQLGLSMLNDPSVEYGEVANIIVALASIDLKVRQLLR